MTESKSRGPFIVFMLVLLCFIGTGVAVFAFFVAPTMFSPSHMDAQSAGLLYSTGQKAAASEKWQKVYDEIMAAKSSPDSNETYEALKALELQIGAASEPENQTIKMNCLFEMGHIVMVTKHYTEAVKNYSEATVIAQELKNRVAHIKGLLWTAEAWSNKPSKLLLYNPKDETLKCCDLAAQELEDMDGGPARLQQIAYRCRDLLRKDGEAALPQCSELLAESSDILQKMDSH